MVLRVMVISLVVPMGFAASTLRVTLVFFLPVMRSTTLLIGVVADIILPPLHTVTEYGESFLDNSLPFDTISKAKNFKPVTKKPFPITKLQKSSRDRITKSKEFNYIQSDLERQKKRIEKNLVTLNKANRLKELNESDNRREQRNTERRKRFKLMEAKDQEVYTFYRLWLEDITKKQLPPVDREKDKNANMRLAKDKLKELNDSPEQPSGLDPIKRESLNIISELIAWKQTNVAFLN